MNSELLVAAWIGCGGFVLGRTSIYDATDLIVGSVVRVSHDSTQARVRMLMIPQDTPIVCVSINDRLGPLGWPQGGR